jgi:hypothetical protein
MYSARFGQPVYGSCAFNVWLSRLEALGALVALYLSMFEQLLLLRHASLAWPDDRF